MRAYGVDYCRSGLASFYSEVAGWSLSLLRCRHGCVSGCAYGIYGDGYLCRGVSKRVCVDVTVAFMVLV
jgi:hypothetical protein